MLKTLKNIWTRFAKPKKIEKVVTKKSNINPIFKDHDALSKNSMSVSEVKARIVSSLDKLDHPINLKL